MKLVKKVNDEWTVIDENLKIHNDNLFCHESNRISALKEHIFIDLVNNKKFIKDFMVLCKSEIYPSYEIAFQLDEDKTVIMLEVDIDKVLNYFKHNNQLKRWQIKAGKEINNIYTDKHIADLLKEKNVRPGLTYDAIINLLKKPTRKIKECIKNNDFNGYDGETFYNIIRESILKSRRITNIIFRVYNLNDEEVNQVEKNFGLIEYNFIPNFAAEQNFHVERNVIDDFKLNEKLKEEVLRDIPSYFNDFQKTYYIYKRLCQKFSYDEDYFYYAYRSEDAIMPKRPYADHTDINRLNNISEEDDIICTEFTMIYCKFLDLLNIPFRITGYRDKADIDYHASHMKARFKIGDYIIDADAAHGLLTSDLAYEKSFGEVNHFEVNPIIPKRYRDKAKKEMQVVDEYFKTTKSKNEFRDAVEIYENDFKTREFVSIKEKVDLLCNMIDKVDYKFIDILSWVNAVRKQLFDKTPDACMTEFIINTKPVKNNKTYELVIIIGYNEEVTIADPSLNKYIVITPDKKREYITYDELRKRFNDGTYDFTTEDRKTKYEGWDIYGKSDDITTSSRKM